MDFNYTLTIEPFMWQWGENINNDILQLFFIGGLIGVTLFKKDFAIQPSFGVAIGCLSD